MKHTPPPAPKVPPPPRFRPLTSEKLGTALDFIFNQLSQLDARGFSHIPPDERAKIWEDVAFPLAELAIKFADSLHPNSATELLVKES
jgi:hypothetical protein